MRVFGNFQGKNALTMQVFDNFQGKNKSFKNKTSYICYLVTTSRDPYARTSLRTSNGRSSMFQCLIPHKVPTFKTLCAYAKKFETTTR
jgi:hypothetical protein